MANISNTGLNILLQFTWLDNWEHWLSSQISFCFIFRNLHMVTSSMIATKMHLHILKSRQHFLIGFYVFCVCMCYKPMLANCKDAIVQMEMHSLHIPRTCLTEYLADSIIIFSSLKQSASCRSKKLRISIKLPCTALSIPKTWLYSRT